MKSFLLITSFVCAFELHAEPLAPISEKELQARTQLLTPLPYKGGAKLKYTGEEAGCAIFELAYSLKDPFSEKFFQYEMKVSWPRSQKPVPVILSVPTIEGISLMEKSVLKQMCKMNVAGIIAHVNNEGFDIGSQAIAIADHQLIRGAVSLRRLIDILENLPAVEDSSTISRILVDTKRIGIVALSVGTISSLLATAVDERIKALFIMGAIGNTPHTLAYSIHSKVKSLRDAQMKRHGFKRKEQYELFLRQRMKATPVQFSSLLAKRNIYQIVVLNDPIAPTSGQLEIQNSTGNTKVFIDQGSEGHGMALATEIMVRQFHLPFFVRTEIL